MKTFAFIVLVSAMLGLCYCEELPSRAEMEEILNDPNRVKKNVDCVITFDPSSCDSRLKTAADLAPEYFSTGGSCRTCSPKDLQEVKRFLQKLQKRYREEYQRLVGAVSSQ